MGMAMQFRRADAATVARLRAGGPDAFEAFIAPMDEYDVLVPEQLIDIDKSWHAIHFLLTGTIWEPVMPAGALLGGESVSNDLGYGPVRLLSGDEVRQFNAVLAGKPGDFIEKSLDFDALARANIYPDIWSRHDPDDIAYVSHFFDNLRTFFGQAANAGDGVVLTLM